MKLMSGTFFPNKRALDTIHKAAKEKVEFHTLRARGLISLIDPKLLK